MQSVLAGLFVLADDALPSAEVLVPVCTGVDGTATFGTYHPDVVLTSGAG